MYWANFLHFYQPPTQKKYWVDRITNEAYRRLVEGLLKTPDAKITLNINSVLTEFWDRYGHEDVIDGLKKLLEREQIELCGSAKFHPLLPKMPRDEIIRQIKLNDETHKKYFGNAYKPKGFFPPEMAYNKYVGEIVSKLGFKWVVIDEISYSRSEGKVDYSKIYKEKGLPLFVFFRDRHVSYRILAGYLGTPKLFLDEVLEWQEKQGKDSYLLTGMDGETFGHHRPGMDKLFFELYKVELVKSVLISDLCNLFKDRFKEIETLPSTWALMEHELARKVPFARWDDPKNDIHNLQWELTQLAMDTIDSSKYKDIILKKVQNSKPKTQRALCPIPSEGQSLSPKTKKDLKILDMDLTLGDREKLSDGERKWLKARELLDMALHSDQFWWASAKPWWSIEMIERGARELLDAIEAVPGETLRVKGTEPLGLEGKKKRGKEIYHTILETAFDWQRSGKVEQISRKEDEIIRSRTDEGFHELDPRELDKMIKNIRSEMMDVAKNQEYERASQLRDRIKELESYKKGKDIKGRI